MAPLDVRTCLGRQRTKKKKLYHVSPLLLLSSSTAASVDLCCHNSFHIVFIFSSHHMTVSSQSPDCILSVVRATPSAFLMTSFPVLSSTETPSIHRSILVFVLSSSPSSLIVTGQAPHISTGLITVL